MKLCSREESDEESTSCLSVRSTHPPPSLSLSSSSFIMPSHASSGVVDRVSSFVSENKKVVLVGAALTVAAVGAGVYFASTSRGGGDPDVERADRKKKKSKSSKKKKTAKDADGPILEEVKQKVEEAPEGTWLDPPSKVFPLICNGYR